MFINNNLSTNKNLKHESDAGFTIVEIAIVLVILTILSTIVIAGFDLFNKRTEVNNTAQEFANMLRLAQSKTISSEYNSQYGVYIDIVSPNRFILFKGTSFALRDTSADRIYLFPKTVEYFRIDASSSSGVREIVFDKLIGTSAQSGNVSIRSKSDISQSKTVYIENSGTVGFNTPILPSDSNKIKDSRHLHFDYNRAITTATENITLNFDNGTVIQIFPISAYLIGSQMEWSETVLVGGINQTIKIRTQVKQS